MTKQLLILCVLAMVGQHAHPAPFIVSADFATTGTQPTHCGLFLDAAPKVEVPVVSQTSGAKFCKFDIAAVATGSHTVTATAIAKDTVWGTLESVKSSPFTFTRPGIPAVPSGFGVDP